MSPGLIPLPEIIFSQLADMKCIWRQGECFSYAITKNLCPSQQRVTHLRTLLINKHLLRDIGPKYREFLDVKDSRQADTESAAVDCDRNGMGTSRPGGLSLPMMWAAPNTAPAPPMSNYNLTISVHTFQIKTTESRSIAFSLLFYKLVSFCIINKLTFIISIMPAQII